MTIRRKIKNRLAETADTRTVKDIRIGLGYTAVVLDGGQAGLAYTPHRDMSAGCSVFSDFMPTRNAAAGRLLELITSDNPIKTAVGLATANALISSHLDNYTTGDVLNNMAIGPDDCVGMVGHFAPLEAPLRKKAKDLIIFERIDRPLNGLLPSSEIENRLPGCTIAIITSTALINHSFEKIITAAENCREVILLGASTPLMPEIFLHTPVSRLSGVLVTDVDEILRIISCGGGMRMFKKCIKKINLVVGHGKNNPAK